MHGLVHIHACVGGIVHLTIGAVTIRLEQEAFQFVAREIERKSQEMRPERNAKLVMLHSQAD